MLGKAKSATNSFSARTLHQKPLGKSLVGWGYLTPTWRLRRLVLGICYVSTCFVPLENCLRCPYVSADDPRELRNVPQRIIDNRLKRRLSERLQERKLTINTSSIHRVSQTVY